MFDFLYNKILNNSEININKHSLKVEYKTNNKNSEILEYSLIGYKVKCECYPKYETDFLQLVSKTIIIVLLTSY